MKINPWISEAPEYLTGKTFEDLIAEYGFKQEDIVRLAGNECTLGPSPKAKQAAQDVLSISNYYDEPNSESLTKALEASFEAKGLDMSKLGVTVGNGMDNIMEHLARIALDKDSSALITSPTFSYYEVMTKRLGADVIDVPLSKTDFGIDPDKIISSIKDNTRIVFLCSPNNPTGSVIALSDIEKIAQAYPDTIVFVDHAYIEFANRDEYEATKIIEANPNIVIGYTFSKAFCLAGYRVGYALMHKDLQKEYLKAITPFVCAKPSLAAARAALADTDHIDQVLEANEIGKEFVLEPLRKMGFEVYPSQTNFYLISHEDYFAADILGALLEQA